LPVCCLAAWAAAVEAALARDAFEGGGAVADAPELRLVR
jgi:hypothetical protein